jgi:hypothetical protein
MLALFLIVGTMAAFSGGNGKSAGNNIALAIITVGCYACAVALEKV